jgi:molybdopterin synthase catalytic subunit
MEQFHIEISEQPLQLAAAAEFVNALQNGALDMFVGRVRNFNMGKPVRGVSYDVFAPLAQTILQQISAEAQAEFGGKLRVYIAHFKGRLEVGGISVVIAVGSPHRDEAFKACRYVIEQLKHRAPIWKQEHYEDGDSEWVKGHTLCGHGH